MSLKTRVDKLETRAKPKGNLVVWRRDDGEPRPETQEGDILLVVVYEDRNPQGAQDEIEKET